jgi:hypothetical protein
VVDLAKAVALTKNNFEDLNRAYTETQKNKIAATRKANMLTKALDVQIGLAKKEKENFEHSLLD